MSQESAGHHQEMNDSEAKCLERFQSLLEVQIEKAREKTNEEQFERREVEDSQKGGRKRSSDNESVLLPPFSGLLQVNTLSQAPCLWQEKASALTETQQRKQDNEEPFQNVSDTLDVQEDKYHPRSKELFYQPSSPKTSHTWTNPTPSPRKRKAPNVPVGSDVECSTLSPNKIFIIPAKEQDQNEQSSVTSCIEKDHLEYLVEMPGDSESSEYNLDTKEEEEMDLSWIEPDRNQTGKAPQQSSSFSQDSPADSTQQAPDTQSEELSKTLTLASSAKEDEMTLSEPRDYVDECDLAGPDSAGAKTLFTAPFSPPVSDTTTLADLQVLNGKETVGSNTFKEDSAAKGTYCTYYNNSTADELLKENKEETENVTDSDGVHNTKKVSPSRNDKEFKPCQTEVATAAAANSKVRSSATPDEDGDYDCDFICRLLTPVRNAQRRGQVSLFQEIKQAQHETEDMKAEPVETQGRLPHPPLRMKQPRQSIVADDNTNCPNQETDSALPPQKSNCSLDGTKDSTSATESYRGSECYNNSTNPSDVTRGPAYYNSCSPSEMISKTSHSLGDSLQIEPEQLEKKLSDSISLSQKTSSDACRVPETPPALEQQDTSSITPEQPVIDSVELTEISDTDSTGLMALMRSAVDEDTVATIDESDVKAEVSDEVDGISDEINASSSGDHPPSFVSQALERLVKGVLLGQHVLELMKPYGPLLWRVLLLLGLAMVVISGGYFAFGRGGGLGTLSLTSSFDLERLVEELLMRLRLRHLLLPPV
ncbi:hypothetical protein ACOMHN_017600 [Nucella lapillus]